MYEKKKTLISKLPVLPWLILYKLVLIEVCVFLCCLALYGPLLMFPHKFLHKCLGGRFELWLVKLLRQILLNKLMSFKTFFFFLKNLVWFEFRLFPVYLNTQCLNIQVACSPYFLCLYYPLLFLSSSLWSPSHPHVLAWKFRRIWSGLQIASLAFCPLL